MSSVRHALMPMLALAALSGLHEPMMTIRLKDRPADDSGTLEPPRRASKPRNTAKPPMNGAREVAKRLERLNRAKPTP